MQNKQTSARKQKHALLPWSVNGRHVADRAGALVLSTPDNSEFVVRACNSHYDLLRALEKLMLFARYSLMSDVFEDQMANEWSLLEVDAAKAIGKAKGSLIATIDIGLEAPA